MAEYRLLSVEFEVYGDVQGVFFRKYALQEAEQHGLVGWVRNTRRGTVLGIVQGPKDKVHKMKHWLCKKGSPRSVIDKCELQNEREIIHPEFSRFSIQPSG
ncbi:hypothetical protein ACJMK2_037457 [Sinanodonta woodiana]|uniref:Acylphosphatase n=1 Tax=Sinanodonta woodiana TaxID=1069815 RepID=A0ABD3WKG2_SINWO